MKTNTTAHGTITTTTRLDVISASPYSVVISCDGKRYVIGVGDSVYVNADVDIVPRVASVGTQPGNQRWCDHI